MEKKYITVVVGALIISIAALVLATGSRSTSQTQGETVASRVLQSGKLRASYLVYPPYFIKDSNTGELSGIFHDLTELVAKELGLKVEWTGEVGYQDIFAGLDAGRYDVFAAGLWPSALRAKAGYFTNPFFYSVIHAYVRSDDHRFDNDLRAINTPEVRIAAVDGAMEDIIANADFPNAEKISLPQLAPFTQNFLNITSGKADVTFAEPSAVNLFLKTNPGAIRKIAPNQPLRIFGNSFVIKRGEDELREMLNSAVNEAVYSGQAAKVLEKYQSSPDEFPLPTLPYMN